MDFLGPSTSDLAIALDGRANGSRYSPASARNRDRLVSSSRNSSQTSIRESEKQSLHSQSEQSEVMAEFSIDSWNRLRKQILSIRRHEEERAELERRMDDHSMQAALANREVAWIKQNTEITVDRLAKKVAMMKSRVAKKRLGACDITQAQDENEMRLNKINDDIAKDERKCSITEAELARTRPRLYVLREMLKHRRRQMIGDVIDIFRIRTTEAPDPRGVQLSKCACPERHFIGAIHLPWTTKLPGHDDITLTAGFALLVQMLQLVSSITDSHLRYPLALRAPGAEITTSDGVPLSLVSNARSKADRARLDAATTLLLRNLAQLRSDCGVHTKRMERTLFVLDDITRVLARGETGEMPAAFVRPWDCSYSLASLMQQPTDPQRSVIALHRNLPSDDDDDPSFLSQGVEMEPAELEAQSPASVVSVIERAAAISEEERENGEEMEEEEESGTMEEGEREEKEQELPGGSVTPPQQQELHELQQPREERPIELPMEEQEDEGMDDEEDEEVLLEPMFNYKRIEGPDVDRLFSRESATAIFAHDKFIVVGTSAGNVWVMDQTGHIDKESAPVYRAHRVAVSRLAVDSSGSYIMSAANDGKVIIKGILCDDLNYTLSVPEVARSIALTGEFARPNSGNVFVVGDRNLTVHSKGFFGYGDKVVYRGSERDGYITRASCQGPFVAFTNEQGTRIFDRSVERVLSVVSPKHDVDRLRSNRHPPQHCWLDNFTLAVGWADTLIIAAITTEDDAAGVRRRRVTIHYSWTVDLLISGVSFTVTRDKDNKWKWDEIVLLGLKVDADGGMNGDFLDTMSMVSSTPSLLSSPISPPASTAGGELAPILQVMILVPVALNEYDLQAEDRISLALRPRTTAAQVHLGALPHDGLYFLLAPHFFILAEPFQPENKIAWRLDNGMVEEAWELACSSADADMKTKVGRVMIQKLIDEDRCKYATSRLKEVCGDSKEEWQYFVEEWEKHRMVTFLSDCIPTGHPKLEPECYEAILLSALYNDIPLYRKLISLWNPDLYRVGSITDRTLARLHEATVSNTESMLSPEDEKSLYLALAHMYNYERKYDASLKIYLALKDKQIFSVVDKFSLFEMVKDQISDLMAIDSDLALRLLLDNEYAVSPATVMTKTARQPKLQMLYLGKLFARHEGDQFADTAVKLYAEHDRKALLPFLKSSEKYNISRALQICKDKGLVEERIFLLGKSGNRIEALNLMISQHNRIDLAISFCQEHEDKDLWAYLVEEIVKRPEHMKLLLSTAGPSLDPLFVVERMPADLVVPGLRDALAKILSDYALQVELQRGCHDATMADVRVLMTSMLGFANAAISVSTRTRCAICDKLILGRAVEGEVLLFKCHHSFHSACAPPWDQMAVPERRRGSATGEPAEPPCPICTDSH